MFTKVKPSKSLLSTSGSNICRVSNWLTFGQIISFDGITFNLFEFGSKYYDSIWLGYAYFIR